MMQKAFFSTSIHSNKQTLNKLFKEMLETSTQIKDYNFRSYFVRRTN